VADLAPLIEENRTLVQRGLALLNRTQRPGLQAMMGVAGTAPGKVTSTTIGFALGPRLNAAGRLDSAMLSYELLVTDDVFKSSQLAGQLNALNARRQQVTAEAFDQAQAQIEADGADSLLHMASSEHFLSGIVGLVAGRLVEQYYRPAIVMELGPQQSRGSARSIMEFDITAALDRCAVDGLLVRHGGHAAAAGLTVQNHKLPALTARLREIAAEELADKDLRPPLMIDQEVTLGNMDFATLGLLQEMEPTGYANPQARLLSRGLLVRDTRKVGADGAHLKLTVSDPTAGGPRSNVTFDAIAFRQGHWHGRLPARVDMVYSLEENVWNGTRRLQLVVEDVRAAA
jgi:single-stranded-DNA-specific exonuclease